MIQKRIEKIVELCKEDISQFPEIESMDFVDIFPISEEEKNDLDKEALKIGKVIEETTRGNFYRFFTPIKTELGNVELIKIRKFDESKLSWLGAGDFVVKDFEIFKEKYQNAPNCKYVEHPTFNAIEIMTKNTLGYVMDIPTNIYYKDKK